MMSAKKHGRYANAFVHFRSRVMRAIEQSVHKRILACRLRIAEHPGQLPHDAIDQHHRRQFAAGEHEVPQTDLAIDMVINEALEIARKFSAPESVQFINGVLDAIRRDFS